MVSLRGEYIRLVKLHNLFKIPGAEKDPTKALVVVVEIEGGKQVGILVDELLGQQQVVIKSLEENYDPVDGISAATILGNGMVALILDVDGLDAMARLAAHKSEAEHSEEELKTEQTGEASSDLESAKTNEDTQEQSQEQNQEPLALTEDLSEPLADDLLKANDQALEKVEQK